MVKRRDTTTHMKSESFYRVGVHDHHICCDCGLTHKVEYQFLRGVVFERWSRDAPKTARERLKHRLTVLREERILNSNGE